ncbi:basal body-orientation factor 1-like [Mercenaria mercenaria]|uniref:basal body-orientation factor 1-like n=1 Tax=Mercenaria mercenaria TaxID=6596 RepID=UPI00234E6E8B|nr:basal body-orientation factor 1-like [Mercenaria mercenaria]
MPKKGKKGKGKKGKKGKGKKGAKSGKKQESVAKIAAANSKVWEARLDIAEKSKQEFRDNAKQLMLENDALQNQMLQTERDTIDVITFLKKEDAVKDNHLERLQQQIRDQKKENRKEKELIVEDFSKQINELEEKLSDKTKDVEMMQSELKMVKEFRRKRGQMQKDLDEIKESMYNANREHKATLSRMEQKFFEEKMRLQQEANQKIAELAERAHTEAIANLDETTKSVYKENVRLSEALSYHMKEGEVLRKQKEKLEEENELLRGDKEINEMMVQEKVSQTKNQKQQIKDSSEKITTLEHSLSHMAREFNTEKKALMERFRIETEASKIELAKLQRIIELKTKEMNKVKRLAKNILDQRTELERFFLEALDSVKSEIAANQEQYRHDAQRAYQEKMLAAHTGKGEFPKIRTFNKSDTSTNSVFKDLEAAERLYGSGKVEVSDLTWEQKERVLRYLFARMNGGSTKEQRSVTSAPVLPAIEQNKHRQSNTDVTKDDMSMPKEDDKPDSTFLTQAKVEVPEASKAWTEAPQEVST